MAPFEPFEARKRGEAHRQLDDALTASGRPSRPGEPAIVTAYRKTNASKARYPNSAELLRFIVGADKLSGGITEIDHEKCGRLADAWAGSRVRPLCSSWRGQVGAGGVLACPEDLQVPWLVSMDPMTYTEGSEADDDKLHRSDIDRVWLFFVGGPGGFCERHGKSYLTRRRRGGEGGGGGSLTGDAIPSAYRWAWFRSYSRASWKSQYVSKSPLARSARSFRTASAPTRRQRAPVNSIRSRTRYRHAPSMTPVAMGQPAAR